MISDFSIFESEYKLWVDAITDIFPSETTQTYYFVPFSKGPPKIGARGKLVNRISNLKRQIHSKETPTGVFSYLYIFKVAISSAVGRYDLR